MEKSANTAEEFQKTIENIRNEIDAADISGLEPPPEPEDDGLVSPFGDMPDFSNISIPSDDELF